MLCYAGGTMIDKYSPMFFGRGVSAAFLKTIAQVSSNRVHRPVRGCWSEPPPVVSSWCQLAQVDWRNRWHREQLLPFSLLWHRSRVRVLLRSLCFVPALASRTALFFLTARCDQIPSKSVTVSVCICVYWHLVFRFCAHLLPFGRGHQSLSHQ